MHNQPRPIGYVELQRHWIGPPNEKTTTEMVTELRVQMDLEVLDQHPGYVSMGFRIEPVKDGAGVWHYNLYEGFGPAHPSSDPLDPRNLSGETTPSGLALNPYAKETTIGMKEQKF